MISGLIGVAGCTSSSESESIAGSDPSQPPASVGSSASSSAGTSVAPTETGDSLVAPTNPGADDPPATITFGPGTFDVPDPTVGLGDLVTYRATLTISFDGTRDGSPERWTKVDTIVVDRQLPGSVRTIERTGREPGTRTVVEIGGATYDVTDGLGCTVQATDGPALDDSDLSAPDEPAGLLPGLIGAEPAGSETVQGIATTRATFDERSFGSLDPATIAGDVWVADEGGYVVRYSLVADGTSAFLGQSATGMLTLEYALVVDSGPAVITAPAGCPPGLIQLPPPADATEIVSLPGSLHYSAPGAPGAIDLFLDEQLAGAGWQSSGDRLAAEAAWLQSFTRGDETLTVTVAAEANGASVTMILARTAT